jgi:hypothetical protein
MEKKLPAFFFNVGNTPGYGKPGTTGGHQNSSE